MKRDRKTPPSKGPSIIVVADGETEAWYLNMLKRNERQIRISIKPEIFNKKSLEDQYELVNELAKNKFTDVFWIVDLDTIIKETREAPKGTPLPIDIFKNYRTRLEKECKNVTVVVNNPCLEFWFLLHFEKTRRVFNSCSKAETQLKIHLKDYEKTRNYFTKHNSDIYLKLKPYLNKALKNAMALGNFDENNPYKAMCEMGSFFFCKELKKHFNLLLDKK